MKRSKIQKLGESRWVKPFDNDALELELVPAGQQDTRGRLWGVTTAMMDRAVCERAFVGFKGFCEDDGKEIPNSLEARMELYAVPALRQFIDDQLASMNAEILSGEDVAASG